MTTEQIVQLVSNLPFLAFAISLWNAERNARMAAEKRERALLRDVAKLGPEDD